MKLSKEVEIKLSGGVLSVKMKKNNTSIDSQFFEY